jgi:hypothetical protein
MRSQWQRNWSGQKRRRALRRRVKQIRGTIIRSLVIVDCALDRLAGCSENLHDGLGPDFVVRNAECHHHPADHPGHLFDHLPADHNGYLDLLAGRSDSDFDFASSLPPCRDFPSSAVFNTFYFLPNSHTVVPLSLNQSPVWECRDCPFAKSNKLCPQPSRKPASRSAGLRDEKGREIIATRIIDLARSGVIDPTALRDRIIAEARLTE